MISGPPETELSNPVDAGSLDRPAVMPAWHGEAERALDDNLTRHSGRVARSARQPLACSRDPGTSPDPSSVPDRSRSGPAFLSGRAPQHRKLRHHREDTSSVAGAGRAARAGGHQGGGDSCSDTAGRSLR